MGIKHIWGLSIYQNRHTTTMNCRGKFGELRLCRCPQRNVWNDDRTFIFPRSKLISHKGMLMRYYQHTGLIFGRHKLAKISHIQMYVSYYGDVAFHCMAMRSPWGSRDALNETWDVLCVGMQKIRCIQRWFRRLLLEKKERTLALMMSSHCRLGQASALYKIDTSVLRLLVLKNHI